MTAVKLLPVGGSLGFELPNDLLDRLKLKAATFCVSLRRKTARCEFRPLRQTTMNKCISQEGMSAYRDALRELTPL